MKCLEINLESGIAVFKIFFLCGGGAILSCNG